MQIFEYLFALVACVTVIKGQCSIPMNDGGLPKPEPLILSPGVGSGFRYPDKNGILQFSKHETVRLVCNGRRNYFKNLPISNDLRQYNIIAQCVQNTQFKILGVTIEFSDLACNYWPISEQRATGWCSGSLRKYEIGFPLDNEFIKLIELCHNLTRVETLYAKFELAKEIGGAKRSQERVAFAESPEPLLSLNAQYNRAAQIDTIGRILGSVDEGKKYINRGPVDYLARGHLAANADFIYGSQKRATYYYINQAPQWQRCNAYDWAYLERDVRTFASDSDQDLTVYTGVHEIAQLPDQNNVQKDLYLSVDSDGTRSIPVPRFFWKVIYNEKTQLGTAFVEINNPWLDPIPRNYKICGKLIKNTRWDVWSSTTDACSSYTCEVDELRKSVNFPAFTVRGILL